MENVPSGRGGGAPGREASVHTHAGSVDPLGDLASPRTVRLRLRMGGGLRMPAKDSARADLLLASQGDHHAFEQLIAPRRDRLLLLAAAVLGDWQEAEDVLQEALWRAYCELHQLRNPEALDAWLRGLTLNVARDRLRAAVARRRREGAPGGDLLDLEGAALAAPQGWITEHAGVEQIVARLAELPGMQRRAAGLAWVVGVPAEEVARILGVSRGAVRACLYRARRRLEPSVRPGDACRRDVVAVGAQGVGGGGSRRGGRLGRTLALRAVRPPDPDAAHARPRRARARRELRGRAPAAESRPAGACGGASPGRAGGGAWAGPGALRGPASPLHLRRTAVLAAARCPAPRRDLQRRPAGAGGASRSLRGLDVGGLLRILPALRRGGRVAAQPLDPQRDGHRHRR